jgi:dihydrofolate synthase/folylpolyglutamate synthase
VTHPDAVAVIREHCNAIGAGFLDARLAALPKVVRLSLEGAHQRHNARVATAAFEELARSVGRPVEPRAIRRGLETARWAGRLQLIPGSPSILLDGAHNPASAEVLGAHLAARSGAKPVLLFGAMADKDIPGILGPLAPHVASVVATQPPVLRAAESRDVAAAGRALGLPVSVETETGAALEAARAQAGPAGVVLVAGSLYLVGAVLSRLEAAGAPGPVSM